MLTTRGWWLIFVIFVLLVYAVLGPTIFGFVGPREQIHLYNPPLVALVPFTLLLWFIWEWCLFGFRSRLLVRQLQISRTVWDGRGAVATLWENRPFHVRIGIRLPGGIGIHYVVLEDRIPHGLQQLKGMPRFEGTLQTNLPGEISYHFRCPKVGKVRFEGLTLELADLQGFFYFKTFVSGPAVYRVLPVLVDTKGNAVGVKRHNLLLPPGIHRHRRPGSGSDLLDLRDYLPGDPPKTIAWKVSARRDRLITKEFESEVPVRCTLFVDISNSVRLGPAGQNALTRLVEIGAAVAQAVRGNRDLAGLCLFDEKAGSYVRPARGPRHMVQLLNQLSEAAGLAPTTGLADLPALLPLGYGLAQEIYPEMLRSDINRFPFWLAWLWPPPTYAKPHPSAADYFYQWLPFLLPVYFLIALVMMGAVFVAIAQLAERLPIRPELVVLFLALICLGMGISFIRIPASAFFPHKRRMGRWRKQLAAVLSVRFGLAPGGLSVLMEDDERFGQLLQQFMADHHIPYPLPLYDRRGRYLFAAPEKIQVLATSLLRCVGKGHDNELFVLLADLLELTDQLDPLLRAVKVALARHHRVMVVCPWPPGIRPPSEALDTKTRTGTLEGGKNLESVLLQTTKDRFHGAFYRLRRTFARLGVPVVCAQSGDPARLILERLDLLRVLGRKR
ncbi:MAG TPA: DUF58 domain-containing protein [Gemmataceae bacterium]|nr:DUF58 domain-containing protein [Gemmataceae bacterium]